MVVQTLFTRHDYACRTNVFGGVATLTKKFIRQKCRTCPARTQDRTCVRNIVVVEKKLAHWKLIQPTTAPCSRCRRDMLIGKAKDTSTLTCERCEKQRAAAIARTICNTPHCDHQGFRGGLCQDCFAKKHGRVRNRKENP